MDPNKKDTQSLARNHIIEIGDDHLITIAGMCSLAWQRISGSVFKEI